MVLQLIEVYYWGYVGEFWFIMLAWVTSEGGIKWRRVKWHKYMLLNDIIISLDRVELQYKQSHQQV